jgi:hypothetical protein
MARSRTNRSTEAPSKPEPADSTEPVTDVSVPEPEPTDDAASTEPTDSTDSTEPTEPADSDTAASTEPEPDPLDVLRAAWAAALAERDDDTGTVPVGPLNGVTTAYRAVARGKRADALLSLTQADSATALAVAYDDDASPADRRTARTLAAASRSLAEACEASKHAPAVPTVSDDDRRGALALSLIALGSLSDDAVTMLAGIAASSDVACGATPDALSFAARAAGDAPEPTDDDGTEPEPAIIVRARAALAATAGRSVKRAQRAAARGATGGNGGKRGSAIATHVRAVLDASDSGDAGMTDAAIAAAASDAYPSDVKRPSTGAIAAMANGPQPARHALRRVTVDGRNGWAVAGPMPTDDDAASTDSDA